MRLYLIQTGIYAGDGTAYPAYLVRTDDQQNILVDTGVPRHIEGDYEEPDVISVRSLIDDKLPARLKAIGLEPHDIHSVIVSHLDFDHCGNTDLFPNAEFIIQRKQYQAAYSGKYRRFEASRRYWDQPHVRYRMVDGDIQIFPGIELIETSGHVPGHQSVLMNLPNTGLTLLTIDAMHRGNLLDPQNPPVLMFTDNEAQAQQSLTKLRKLARRRGVQLVVVGHDPKQWPHLKHSPDYYD